MVGTEGKEDAVQRKRSGFLLPGIVLTALACIGVVMLIASAVGVLPDELPVLRSSRTAPRRNANVTVPPPTTRPPSPTKSATPSFSPSPTRSATPSPTGPRPTVTASPTRTATVAPTTRPPATTPPPPSCKPGSATATAVADAYVDQDKPTQNYGTSDTLLVRSRERQRNTRAVLRFPMPTVPKGCTVTGGTLTMTALDVTGRRLLVARGTKAWAESSVTWGNGPWPTGSATGATVSSTRVVWSLPASTVTSAYGLVVYDSAENARGAGVQTRLASRTARGAPTLTIRWA